VSGEPLHLRVHAPVAERALLPGDPGRALRLAQQLVDTPKMLNHHRGLWGYTGVAADGAPLTIQSTGLGAPSTAIVAEELIGLGARRLVRVGTCSVPARGPEPGSLVIADAVLPGDGASRALGATRPLAPDAALLAALRAACGSAAIGTVASTDLFYGPDPEADGALAVDLSSAALLAVAGRHRAAAACVLVVAHRAGEHLDAAALERAEAELGRVAVAAVSSSSSPPAGASTPAAGARPPRAAPARAAPAAGQPAPPRGSRARS
jgi:uridine phosphorylase